MNWQKRWEIVGSLVSAIGAAVAISMLFPQVMSSIGANSSISLNSSGTPPRKVTSFEKRVSELIDTVDDLQARTEALIEANKRLPAESASKIADLESEVSALSDQTLGLRQAINPSAPEEILTIARLGDQLDQVSRQQLEISNQVEKQLITLKDDMQSEIDRMSAFQLAILAVILPLVFSFIASHWWGSRNKSDG